MPTVKARGGVASAGAAAGIRSASPQGRASTPTLGAPVILSFTSSTSAPAAGSFPEPGDDATLAWSVMNATGISIDQGVGAVTGTSLVVTPSATTTYTLTATNSITGEVATAQALAKVRILVNISGTQSILMASTVITNAGETIDSTVTQEFVLQLQSGAVVRGIYPFAALSHYGTISGVGFHPSTRVYLRAHTDAASGTTPIIGAAGAPGGYGSYSGGTKASVGSGGGGGSAGYPGGVGGDSCLTAERGGSFQAQAGDNSSGGEGASGGAGGTLVSDCDGGAGLDGAVAILVSSYDVSIPGNLWLDISTSVNGGIKIIGGAGGGGGGTILANLGGSGGTGGGPGLNGLAGDHGTDPGGAGDGHPGGSAGAALSVVTSTGKGSYGVVGNDFGPSFLGNNTSGAGAVTET